LVFIKIIKKLERAFIWIEILALVEIIKKKRPKKIDTRNILEFFFEIKFYLNFFFLLVYLTIVSILFSVVFTIVSPMSSFLIQIDTIFLFANVLCFSYRFNFLGGFLRTRWVRGQIVKCQRWLHEMGCKTTWLWKNNINVLSFSYKNWLITCCSFKFL
jgi:hypothetical protein